MATTCECDESDGHFIGFFYSRVGFFKGDVYVIKEHGGQPKRFKFFKDV